MTDLGFGVVDRRSILAVLFTLGLSVLTLGNTIPIDTTNLLTGFLGLLMLSGFIYGARSVLRVALAMCVMAIRGPFDLTSNFVAARGSTRGVRGVLVCAAQAMFISFYLGFFQPLFIVRDWGFGYRYARVSSTDSFLLGIMGIVDRVMLIGIAFVATLPQYANSVNSVGIIGIGVLILLYALTGRFSLVLEDAMHRTERENLERHHEQVQAAKNPNISFPSTIYTRPDRNWGP